MNERKKQTANKQKPIEVIEVGEIRAEVFLSQANCGLTYYRYFLTRAWRAMATGKVAHGSALFESNEQDVLQAVRKVSARIRELAAKATGTSAANHN